MNPQQPLRSPARAIAVIGEALVDVFPGHEAIGGAPFNVARNLAALGCAPAMLTRIGDDVRGERIASEFERFGMDTSGLQIDAQRPTGTVSVHVHDGQHRFEIERHQAWDALDEQTVVEAVRSLKPSIIYFGTLAQRERASRDAIRAALNASSAIRFVDINLRDGPDNETLAAQSLALAQIVKVNDGELDRLLEWFVHPGQAAPAFGSAAYGAGVLVLMQRFDVSRLVVTRGAKGYAAFDRARGLTHLGNARPVRVRDTVGAGDAFMSVLLLGELHGWPLDTTLERANAFASAVCMLKGGVGADLASYAEWAHAWSGAMARAD